MGGSFLKFWDFLKFLGAKKGSPPKKIFFFLHQKLLIYVIIIVIYFKTMSVGSNWTNHTIHKNNMILFLWIEFFKNTQHMLFLWTWNNNWKFYSNQIINNLQYYWSIEKKIIFCFWYLDLLAKSCFHALKYGLYK